MAIYPENDNDDVDQIISAFNWNGDKYIGNQKLKEMLI
jgi:sulfite reductase alpha subunit-like flavoprotein